MISNIRETAAMSVLGLVSYPNLSIRRVLTGGGEERPIGLPLLIEHEHPPPVIAGSELVMTSGSLLPDAAWPKLVDRLVEGGAAALLIGFGSSPLLETAPEALMHHARERNLTVLSASLTDFNEIARVVTHQHERAARDVVEQALDLQMDLTAVITRGGGIGDLLQDWRAKTLEPAAVLDRLGQTLARTEEFPQERLSEIGDEIRARVPRVGDVLKLPVSITDDNDRESVIEIAAFAGNDIIRGYLARIPSDWAPAQLAAPALRSLLALDFERHWFRDEPARRERAEKFARVLARSDSGGARSVLRSLGVVSGELRGLAIEARNTTHAEVIVDDLAAMFATPLIRHKDRLVECLVTSDPRTALKDYRLDVPAGFGTSVAPEHAARTMRQALLALETSRRVGGPIEYLDGASHEFLIRAAPSDYLESFADAVLTPIERDRGGDDLVATLHMWLVEGRSIETTAERLGVHRHTVRNRLRRVSQLTGHNLDGIDTQTELWLALKARGYRYEV